MVHFGFVTIGQSPRHDVITSMLDTHHAVRFSESGALDDLPRVAIEALLPRNAESPLVTTLRDGSEVVVSKPRLAPHLQAAVNSVEEAGADVVVILCTGAFSYLESRSPIIYPDTLLRNCVNALLPAGTLGVLMPHQGQMDTMERKWQLSGRRFVGAVASPYSSAGAVEALARSLAEQGARLIVMDCMGYSTEMRDRVVAGAGVPAVLSNRLVGQIVEELAGRAASGRFAAPTD
jgi:protein AroM